MADELGTDVARSEEEALAADLVVTMTPGNDVAARRGLAAAGPARQPHGRGRAGQGGDRRRRAGAGEVFCDDWEQASHDGELAHAVEAALVARERRHRARRGARRRRAGAPLADEITAFDSTGLAIQDLAIALAALGAPQTHPACHRSI